MSTSFPSPLSYDFHRFPSTSPFQYIFFGICKESMKAATDLDNDCQRQETQNLLEESTF